MFIAAKGVEEDRLQEVGVHYSPRLCERVDEAMEKLFQLAADVDSWAPDIKAWAEARRVGLLSVEPVEKLPKGGSPANQEAL